jgi:hypothetical protein
MGRWRILVRAVLRRPSIRDAAKGERENEQQRQVQTAHGINMVGD